MVIPFCGQPWKVGPLHASQHQPCYTYREQNWGNSPILVQNWLSQTCMADTTWNNSFCPRSLDGRVQLCLRLQGWEAVKSWETQAPTSCCLKGSICGALCLSGEEWVPYACVDAATEEGKEVSLGHFEASLWQPGPAGLLCVPENENSHPCWSSPPCSSQGCPTYNIPTISSKPPPICDSHIKHLAPQDQSKRTAAVAPCFPTEQSLSSSKWLPLPSSSKVISLIKKKNLQMQFTTLPVEKIAAHQVSGCWQR